MARRIETGTRRLGSSLTYESLYLHRRPLVAQPAIQLFAELGWLMTSGTNLRRTRDLLPRLLSGQVALDLAEGLSQDTVELRATV